MEIKNGDAVVIKRSGEQGVVTATWTHVEDATRFNVEYTSKSGQAKTEWFSGRELSLVSEQHQDQA